MKKAISILILLGIVVMSVFFVSCNVGVDDVAETPPPYDNYNNDNIGHIEDEDEQYYGTEQILTEDNDSSFSEILRVLNKMFDIEDFELGEERTFDFVHPYHGLRKSTWQAIDLLGEQISVYGLERTEVGNAWESQQGDIMRANIYDWDDYNEVWQINSRRIMIDIGPAPDWSPQHRAYYVIYLE